MQQALENHIVVTPDNVRGHQSSSVQVVKWNWIGSQLYQGCQVIAGTKPSYHYHDWKQSHKSWFRFKTKSMGMWSPEFAPDVKFRLINRSQFQESKN